MATNQTILVHKFFWPLREFIFWLALGFALGFAVTVSAWNFLDFFRLFGVRSSDSPGISRLCKARKGKTVRRLENNQKKRLKEKLKVHSTSSLDRRSAESNVSDCSIEPLNQICQLRLLNYLLMRLIVRCVAGESGALKKSPDSLTLQRQTVPWNIPVKSLWSSDEFLWTSKELLTTNRPLNWWRTSALADEPPDWRGASEITTFEREKILQSGE